MAGFLLIPHPIKEYIGAGTASGIESTLLIVALFLLVLSLVLKGSGVIDKQAAPRVRPSKPVVFALLAIVTL
ncbi:hypothetical protein ABI118_15475, partial [Enterococcus faecium]|uniref:hypothetical protein n=1 Tax=Enterococcus faecium TaxID=1352 RepID=UPI003F42C136